MHFEEKMGWTMGFTQYVLYLALRASLRLFNIVLDIVRTIL